VYTVAAQSLAAANRSYNEWHNACDRLQIYISPGVVATYSYLKRCEPLSNLLDAVVAARLFVEHLVLRTEFCLLFVTNSVNMTSSFIVVTFSILYK